MKHCGNQKCSNIIWIITILPVLTSCSDIFESDTFELDDTITIHKNSLHINNISQAIKIDDGIRDMLNIPCGEKILDIDLIFDDTYEIKPPDYLLDYKEGSLTLNGTPMTDKMSREFYTQRLNERLTILKASLNRKKEILKELNNKEILIDMNTKEFLDGNEPLRASIDACNIKNILDLKYLIGIEHHLLQENESIDSALLSTHIMQSFAYPNNNKGNNVGIYMSETNCPNTNYIYYYTRLTSGSDDLHSTLVSTILRRSSTLAQIYCRHGSHLPYSSDIGYNIYSKPIFIASLSYGSNYSNSYNGQDKSADDLIYNYYISIVKSAGNKDKNNPNGYVTSPGKGLNVITVGSYDDHEYWIDPSQTTQYFTLSDFSPIIPPNTGNRKPELVAPGEKYTHTYNNVQYTNRKGTSFAAPIVAGMLANYLSSFPSSPNYALNTPNLMKAAILLGATDPIIGNANYYGEGGADYERMYNIRAWREYSGVYESFDSAKLGDPIPNNDALDFYTQSIPSSTSQGRIAVSWITRGTYTYSHRNDAYPIGQSYSVRVLDPNGNQVGYNLSWYNNYVTLNFNRPVTGVYHVEIRRFANRDTNAKFQLAYALYY